MTVHGKLKLAPWQVEALCLSPRSVLDALAALPSDAETAPGIKIGADLRYWQVVARFALELLVRQRIKPAFLPDQEHYDARWQPVLDEPAEQERVKRLVEAMPAVFCRAVFRDETSAQRAATPAAKSIAPQMLLERFLATTIDAFARVQAVFELPPFPFHHTAARAWLAALCDQDPVIKESAANLSAFHDQYRAWTEPVEAIGTDTFRICFRLDPPAISDTEGIVAPATDAPDWSLRYFLQAADDPSLLVPAEAVWRERGSELRFLNHKFDAPPGAPSGRPRYGLAPVSADRIEPAVGPARSVRANRDGSIHVHS